MICKNCGTYNDEDSSFCKNCGADLTEQYDDDDEESQGKTKVKTRTKTKKHTKTKYKNKKEKPKEKTKVVYRDRDDKGSNIIGKIFNLFLILIIIALLIIAGVFGYNYYKENYNIEVPDFSNMTYEEASVKAAKLNLNTKEKDKIIDDETKNNIVISQNKKAGSKLKSGDTITLTVGKIDNTYKIENYVGKNINDVTQKLKINGINYSITYENSDKNDGVIINQSIKSGTTVDKGSTIVLTVSKKIIESTKTESNTENTTKTESNTIESNESESA